MAAYNSAGGGDDMYSDAETPAQAEAPEDQNEDEGAKTAIVPQSLCPGMKVGDEFKVKIERVLEDDYEISYPEGTKPETTQAAPAPEGGEMASMME